MKLLYNLYVDCYNLYVTLYNHYYVRWRNRTANQEDEYNLIPTSLYNEQVEEYNRHVDEFNKDKK